MVTFDELHGFAVEAGIAQDPRDRDEVERELEKREKEYEDLGGVRKEKYDEDRLDNPYDDSKVLHGADSEVSRVAVGIDMETQDLLLVDRLQERGEDIDGVIAHHPKGAALARLADVMNLQIDTLKKAGVPISQAEAAVRPRIQDVRRGTHGINHPRVPMAAERLDLPLMTLHTVTDNFAHAFIKDYLAEEDPRTMDDLVDTLLDVPEYAWALEYAMGPEIFVGSEENRVGNLAFDFTGGTELDKSRMESMATSGVNTIVAMHMSKEQIEAAEEQNINVVSAGHMPSDSLGINLFLDDAIDEFDLEVVELSGFKRVDRR
ncbi:MAG: NGG1p interacting factor NIF3 [Candidatus Nanohaloarchaea archaeon]